MKRLKLGVMLSHPVQYYSPLFRELSHKVDLTVYYAHRQVAEEQAGAGFGVAFDWDVDLLDGYDHLFLENRSRKPDVGRFLGCDTPSIAEEVRVQNFDAFLVMGWYLKAYWQAIWACRREGIPVMVRGDSQLATPGSRAKKILKAVIYPTILRVFDGYLYVGERNKEYLRHYGVPKEKLFFSPHCIDAQFFSKTAGGVDREQARKELGIHPLQKAVFFVGKLLDSKQPLDIVHALKILSESSVDCCAVFIGDGVLRDSLKKVSGQLGIPSIFTGFQNQSVLPRCYVAADVLVLPSTNETWGLVINEALACGTPVVVSNTVGCAPDMVDEGQTGAEFSVGNIKELSEAISRALQIPRDSEAIIAKTQAYSVRAAVSGIVDATESLVKN